MSTEQAPTMPAIQSSVADDKQEALRELQMLIAIRPFILKCLSLNHDINNPLAGIIGYGEILTEDENLTAEQKGHLKQIMICAERIRAKVNELCDAKVQLQGEVDLREVIERISTSSSG